MKQFDRDKLRALCKQKGYTGSDLAKLIGVSTACISHYMTGRSAPSFVHMKRLADIFMCEVDDLMKGERHKEVVFQEAEAAPSTPITTITPMEILEVEKKPEEKKPDRDDLLCSALEAATELLRMVTEILKDARKEKQH